MRKLCVVFVAFGLTLLAPISAVFGNQSDPTGGSPEPARYFVKSYAHVLAGGAIDKHCKFFNPWQKELLKRHAKALEPVMGQRLTTQSRNQVLEISNKLILDSADCGDEARATADSSLFSAHALLFGRPPNLVEGELNGEMKSFLDWARAEIAAHEERRARRLAEIARQKQERANQYLHFTASTEGYYVERLCQHLGGNDTRTYWKIIADAHKAAVAQHGVRKVKKIQAKAVELAKAQSRKCGAESRKLVIEGFKLAKQGFEISSLVLP